MIRKTKPHEQARAFEIHRFWRSILGVILCATMAGPGVLAAEPTTHTPPADPLQVVGRWQRTDGGYILELRNPTFDGGLAAAYFNPRPINVARSGWALKDGTVLVLVELRDQGYPGSTYTLAYRPDSDRLVGIYFQAVVQQQFEVVFQRIE